VINNICPPDIENILKSSFFLKDFYPMAESSETKVYVFYYKKDSILKSNQIYQPVMAGNAILSGNGTIPGDDSGVNISAKNPCYSELTRIYRVWKNTSHLFQKVII
jgi:hypothetical protein